MRNSGTVLKGLGMAAACFVLAGTSFAASQSSKTAAQSNSKQAGKSALTVSHVLLLSIDGMHALDFINCANGISGANGGAPYCPNIAALKPNGVNYLYASTSEPSDSFPGLMALPGERWVPAQRGSLLRRRL